MNFFGCVPKMDGPPPRWEDSYQKMGTEPSLTASFWLLASDPYYERMFVVQFWLSSASGELQKGCRDQMTTGKKPASNASRQLRSPNSTPAERRVAASDLAQAKKKPKK